MATTSIGARVSRAEVGKPAEGDASPLDGSGRRRVLRPLLLWALALLVVWAGAELIAPGVIRSAYRGESLEALNRVITGQAEHPPEFYIQEWRSLVRRLLALAAVAVLFWFTVRPRLAKLLSPLLHAEPRLSPGATMKVAFAFGVLAGVGEAAHLTIRHLIERHPVRGFSWDLVWIAPASATVFFLAVGVLLLLVVRLLTRTPRPLTPAALRLVVAVFAFLACYSLLESPRLRLHPIATVLLSLGVAWQVGRVAAARPSGVARLLRVGFAGTAITLAALLAYGWATLPGLAERRALANLSQAREGAPNVLLLVLDTVRAANLGLYGYARATTPVLREWADSGAVFDRAIATSPWTLPSHSSLFTGRYHSEVSADWGTPLDATFPTLAEVLASEGYATAGFTANQAYTTEASGLARGFARYEDYPLSFGRFLLGSALLRNVSLEYVRGWTAGRKSATAVTDEFLSWLSERDDRPFFAFLNFMDAHSPYTPEPPFTALFPEAPRGRGPGERTAGITTADLEGTVAAYDRAIAYMDHEIGRLLDTLRSAGILDRTIVIITSDHGEQFGEHGLQFHSNSLYMQLLHVPLIVVYPPGVPRGARVAAPVSIRDLPATVLDLAGLENAGIPGVALSEHWRPAAEGRPVSEARPGRPALAEVSCCRPETTDWEPVSFGDMKALVEGDFHYILRGDGKRELYDVATDVAEERDLADVPEHAERLARFGVRLDSVLRTLEASSIPAARAR